MYNNSYQAIIKIAPFKALGSRRCRAPICCNDLEDTLIIGPKMAEEIVYKIKVI